MVESSDLQIAEVLRSLGHPVRLSLLRRLRQPHSLAEIHKRALRDEGPHVQEPLTAEAFHREYLEPLIHLGVVTFHGPSEGGVTQYVLNHPVLYALAEKVNDVGRLRDTPASPQLAVRPPPLPQSFQIQPPCLVLVKGLWEGQTFALPRNDEGSWVLGRSRSADVCLDYDPYIGANNTRLTWQDGRYRLHDLATGEGTRLNFVELARGASQNIRNGDVIGVGRSLLMVKLAASED